MAQNIRRCCVTNEPVHAGYEWFNGDIYKYEDDLVKQIIKYLNEFYNHDRMDDWVVVDKDTLLRVGWYFNIYYYTEWEAGND